MNISVFVENSVKMLIGEQVDYIFDEDSSRCISEYFKLTAKHLFSMKRMISSERNIDGSLLIKLVFVVFVNRVCSLLYY